MDRYLRGCLYDDEWVLLEPETLDYPGSWGWNSIRGRVESGCIDHLKFWHGILELVEGPVFLDIGAGTGSFCLLGAFVLDVTCIAFEPNRELVPILRANIEANELSGRVRVHPFALSDRDGSATLTICDDHPGLATVGEPSFLGGHPDHHTLEVQTHALDSLQLDDVDFIKIDAEGAELLILKGAEQLIRRCWPGILAETYSARTRQLGYDGVEIGRWLDRLGYHGCAVGNFDTYFWKQEAHRPCELS